MNKTIIRILILLTLINCKAQSIPDKEEIVNHFGFEQKSIIDGEENIVFYTYQKGSKPKSKMVLFLQGSDPSPQFSYFIRKAKIVPWFYHWKEYELLSDEYLYVIIEKIGFDKLMNGDSIQTPKIYNQKNSLDNRVYRANKVISYLGEKTKYEKIIVYGHSEGAPVAAKLGTVNKQVTHLGFWCGNALPDFYDFIIENRIMYHKGELSIEESHKQIDENLIGMFKKIAKDTANVDNGGYTNLRWWSYAEPPINHLLKIEIPIFVQVATEDISAPIESTYLIPLEFARLGKKNLTYEICVGCDHGFFIKKEGKKSVQKWHEIFKNFIRWTEKNNH